MIISMIIHIVNCGRILTCKRLDIEDGEHEPDMDMSFQNERFSMEDLK